MHFNETSTLLKIRLDGPRNMDLNLKLVGSNLPIISELKRVHAFIFEIFIYYGIVQKRKYIIYGGKGGGYVLK